MRVAAIDVGTNSTRLLVAEQTGDGPRTIDRRTRITRLGEGVDRTGALAPEALRRTLEAVADYAAACGEYGVGRIRVAGTSAVRDACNRDSFVDGVAALTGSAPEVLSGEREARLTFSGATAELDPATPKLVVDIGGGSTELVSGRAVADAAVSLDIGCVRLLERHLRTDPPAPDELGRLRAEASAALRDAARAVREAGTVVVGVAGTVTQLAALKAGLDEYDPEVIHHMTLSHSDVRMLARRLESLPLRQRRRTRGLEPGRADVIVPGAEILLAVMDAFEAPEVLVSERDILDGLVGELLDAPGSGFARS